MSRFIIKAANFIVSFIVVVCLCIGGVYAAYALWDNNRIYVAAEDVRADMIKLKPVILDEGESARFEDLVTVNPDICAWVTLDQTQIDYPVLHGSTNLTYINRDVYGNFALQGSIYLDTRNNSTYSDAYNVLYGHHMENSKMFGDLDLYKGREFFEQNTTGTLVLPDRVYRLKVFACLLVKASDDCIFSPEQWRNNIDGLIEYVRENALLLHEDTVQDIEQREKPQVLALTTCSSEFTDARTIVLAAMMPYQNEN